MNPRRAAGACVFAASVALCSPPDALAQERPAVDSANALTLPAAAFLAEAQAPDRMVAAARLAVAHTEVAVASMLTNPTVLVGSALATAHFYTAISIPVPLFGQREAARAVAAALESAVRHDVEVTRLDVRYAATLAWIDLWLAEEEAVMSAETADRAEHLAGVTDERFNSGAAPRLDLLRARAEALRLRAESESATFATLSTSARLAMWIGHDASSPLHTIGTAGEMRALPALNVLLQRVDHHALMLAALTRTSAAQASVALERRRRWPIIGFEAGANFFDPSLASGPMQPTPGFADAHVSLSFEVPLFNLHGPLIARAQAGVSQSTWEAESVRRRLCSDITAAYAEVRAADARARVQRSAVLPAAQEAADLALEAYRAGRVDINGVLSAQQALADARRAAYRAEADLSRAVATLTHAVGGPW